MYLLLLFVVLFIFVIDQYNIPHLLNYQVQFAAGIAFQLGPYRDREVYPVVLPILSLLVNYGTSFFFFYTKKWEIT